MRDGHSQCTPFDVCRDCHGPPPKAEEDGYENCRPIEYKKYYISDYYLISGVDKMKAEIYKYGPISCGMFTSMDFIFKYDGGIYSEYVDDVNSKINHEVSVVGYGKDEKTNMEYWIVRNSFGTNWGDRGFFYIEMHKNNLGLEVECIAGLPTFHHPMESFIQ